MTDADQLPLLIDLDSPLRGSVKNERSVMVYNFFALERKRTDPIRYDDGRVKIEVKGTEAGIATIYDKELLIYVASLLVDKINRGEQVDQKLTFSGHDVLRVLRVANSGTAYDRVSGALERLQGTQIKTNIETGGAGTDSWFSWLKTADAEYRKNAKGEKVLRAISVELCDWLYRAIIKDGRMLTYDPAYFDLPPLEKRLYEMARAHCGSQAGFRIGLEKLQARVGVEGPTRNFRSKLKKISERERPLPEYAFKIVDTPAPGRRKNASGAAMVIFWRLDRWRDYAPDTFLEVED